MSAAGPRRSGWRARSVRQGFTLLELVLALLVLAILLGYALPSYQRYLQRGQRAEAVRLLLTAAACQERIRAGTGMYDTTRCVGEAVDGPWSLRIEPPGTDRSLEFTLIAEPARVPANDRCGSLTLDQTGTRGVTGDAAEAERCWGGR